MLPDSVSPTTVENSGRLLTRRRIGVRPIGAQVVAVLARHDNPVSSPKPMVASWQRASFDPRPMPLEPGFDQRLITSPGIDRWLSRTPPQDLQPAGEIMGMIVHTKLHHDQGMNTAKRPSIGLKARIQGSLFEQLQ